MNRLEAIRSALSADQAPLDARAMLSADQAPLDARTAPTEVA